MNSKVTNIVKQADSEWEAWNGLGCAARANLLLRWAAEIAQQGTFGLISAKMVEYQVKQGSALIAETQLMPGPTGESNELYTAGRGIFIIRCSADAPITALVGMVAASLLAGNCIILSLAQEQQQNAHKLQSTLLSAGIAQAVVQVAEVSAGEELSKEPSTAGVAYVGSSAESLKINRQLAAREGLLAQLIAETEFTSLSTITDSYFILRFITERTRTINVTAIGGNAALLELGCGDY